MECTAKEKKNQNTASESQSQTFSMNKTQRLHREPLHGATVAWYIIHFFPIEGFTHNTEMHSHFYRTSEELYAETRSNFLISQCTESNVNLFGFTVNNLLVILDI